MSGSVPVSQIALPLGTATGISRIVLGAPYDGIVEAFAATATWPYRTAILSGPPRSGKSLLARYFVSAGLGEAIDDAASVAEHELFHRWNRVQQTGQALLLVNGRGRGAWRVALPDLASRLGAALSLEIGPPDDAVLGALAIEHAARRGLVLGEGSLAWLLPRIERSHAAVEQIVVAADRLSLERRQPVTISLLRHALAASGGEWQPRLL